MKIKIDKRLQFVLDLLLLAALFWVVRYWHSRQFGLYEDDLTIIPDAFTRTFASLIGYIGTYISHFYGHARPLSDSGIYLFAWAGWHMAGLWGPYLIGYAITVINIGLFYGLMRRVAGRPFALLAGLAYLLYSADTTQAFLTHSLGLQSSFTLVLLAMHLYLSGKRLPAYLLALVVLFDYELPFLLFAAVPLFEKTWDRKLFKRFLIHVGILLAMLVAIYGFRSAIGETRVAGLSLKDTLLTPPLHAIEGPVVNLGMLVYRPLQALRGLDLEVALAIVLAFALFFWIISRLAPPAQVSLRDLWSALKDPAARQALPGEVRSYAISGRDTRVHAAGVAGIAVMVAAGGLLLFSLVRGRWRLLVSGALALELALLAGYGFVIQKDYVDAWQYQRQFWTELVPLIPDAGPGTVVLVDPAALHDTRQIGANYWNLPRVLFQLYSFPGYDRNVPVVHRLEPNWQSSLLGQDGKFLVNAVTVYSVPDYYGSFDPQDVILIQVENSRLVRRTSVTLNGQTYSLKPLGTPVLTGQPHGPLYNLMLIQP